MNSHSFEKQRLSRYELKYLIPQDYVYPVSEFIKSYCDMDPYSKLVPGGFYTINSLYFDTEDYLFLKWRVEQEPKRFNLRMRSYGENPLPPYFAEVKYREGMVIRKTRVPFTSEPQQYLDSRDDDEFLGKYHFFNCAPKVFTQYKRLAWFSTVDKYARITFDKELVCHRQNDYSLIPDNGRLYSYDFEEIFPLGCNIILELKTYRQTFPLWFFDLIHYFGLKKASFSKYANAMNEVFRCEWFESDCPDTPAFYRRTI